MVAKLGVLGGMGPLATVDFLRKLVAATPADTDQDHITTVAYCACHIPDRTAAIVANGPSPLQELLKGVHLLEQMGADCIVIPCNTAHFWYPQLMAATAVPIFHIIDAACDHAAQGLPHGAGIGVLATTGTIRSGVYQERISARGFHALVPDAAALEQVVMPAIRMVKAGNIEQARQLLTGALERLRQRGAARVVLGCTEIPVVLHANDTNGMIDATDVLVRKCVHWWLEQRSRPPPARENRGACLTAVAENMPGPHFA